MLGTFGGDCQYVLLSVIWPSQVLTTSEMNDFKRGVTNCIDFRQLTHAADEFGAAVSTDATAESGASDVSRADAGEARRVGARVVKSEDLANVRLERVRYDGR